MVAAGLCKYILEWEKVTKNPISLQAKDKAIQNLLQLKTIQVVPKDTKGFQSSVFAVLRIREDVHLQPKGKFPPCYSGCHEDCSILTLPVHIDIILRRHHGLQ